TATSPRRRATSCARSATSCTSNPATWRRRGSGWKPARRSTGSTEGGPRLPRPQAGAAPLLRALFSAPTAPHEPSEIGVACESGERLAPGGFLPPPGIAVDGERQGSERERRITGARV